MLTQKANGRISYSGNVISKCDSPGKEIVARFDGGRLSSDGGLLVLREIEQRLKVADRLAACIDDPRDPASTVHSVADIIRFRMR